MATEAEIIPEPISIVKTEAESRHLTSELCKQFASGFNQPAEADECLAKPENMQAPSDNGVETKSSISEGNADISKGESFLMSPEIVAVAGKETTEMSEHSQVDETPIKADNLPEDEKLKVDEKSGNEVEAGIAENQVKTTEDSLEKGDIDEGTSLKTKLEEESTEVEVVTNQDSSLVEKSGSIEEESSCSQESKQEEKRTNENADPDKEVPRIPEAKLELEKQASIDVSNPLGDILKPNETEFSISNLVQEEEEQKSSIGVKGTEPEKQPVLLAKEDGTDAVEAIEPIETSGNQAALDEKEDREIPVPLSETNIDEVESVNDLKQSQEGNLDKAEILKESFQQQNEPEKEKPACPINEVPEDVNAAISSENEETSKVTSITDHTEKSEGEAMEDTIINNRDVSDNKDSKETIEVKENTESVEAGIPKKNADDLHVADSSVGQSVEKDTEQQYELPDSQPEEQAHEANVESKEKEEQCEVVSEAATTTDFTSETSKIIEENVEVSPLDSEKCSEKDEVIGSKQDGIQEKEADSTEEKAEIETRGDVSENDATEESNKKETVIAEEDSEQTKEPQENIEWVASEETETVTTKANEIPSLVEEETVQEFEETTQKEEKVKGENDDNSTKDKGIENEEVETITKDYELESKEQPESKDAVQNIEENSKPEETEQVCESSEPTMMEERAIEDDIAKSAEEEMQKSIQEDKQEEIPEVEVCEKLEINDTVEHAEKQIVKEEDTHKDQLTQLTETEEEKSKEASNSNIEEVEPVAEIILQTSEETAEQNNNPNPLDTAKESNEIATKEIKEDLVSSFETKDLKQDSEEEASVKGSSDTAGLDVSSTATETEETSIKEVEAEEKGQKIDNVIAVEKDVVSTTEEEEIGVGSADIDVKPADSISYEKDREIPQEEDRMQDKVPNTGSEDQLETSAKEIPQEEILGDEMKEQWTVPSEEHEHAPIEETKMTDETPEKDEAPYEHSENPVPQATDETLMQMDVPKVESEDSGKQSGHDGDLAEEPNVHTEETEKCVSVPEATDVLKGEEEPGELENQIDACESKTSEEEQSSDSRKDVGKAIQEEENLAENLAKPESLKEDTEVEKEETELLIEDHNQMPESINSAENAEQELAGGEEEPKSESEKVVEEQKKELFPEPSNSPADETSTDVQNQESEKEIKEELQNKLEDEDYINREQNTDEVTKAVVLSEEVDKEVKKTEDSEDIKDHVTKEEDEGTKEAAETNGILETSAEQISEGVEAIVEDDVSSHNTFPEEKQEDQHSANKSEEEITSSALLPKEHEETVTVVEKIEEETLKEVDTPQAKISEDEKKTAEISLEKEEIVELEDVKKDETPAARDLHAEEPKDQSTTSTSILPSEDVEHGTTAKADEIEEEAKEVELLEKEISQEPEAVVDQEEKQEEHLQPSAKLPSEDEEVSNAHLVEKIEEEIQKDAEVVKHESLENSSGGKTTEEVCPQKVEEREFKGASEEETISDQGLEKEEPEEQIQTTLSTLPSEDKEHGTGITTEESEYDKTKEEVPAKLDVLNGKEITGEQILLANKSEEETTSSALLPKEQEEAVSMVEKIEEESMKEEETPEIKISEDSSGEKKTAAVSFEKEEFPEVEDAKKDETPAAQDLQVDEPEDQSLISPSSLPTEDIEHGAPVKADEIEEGKVKEVELLEKERPQEPEAVADQEEKQEEQLQNSASTLPSQDEEIRTSHVVEKIEEETQKDAEVVKHESLEDSSNSTTTKEVCLEKAEQGEAALEEASITGRDLEKEEPEEQIQTTSSTLPSEEKEHETGVQTEEIEYDKTKEEVPAKPDVLDGEEITGERALSANKSEEENTSSALLVKEQEDIVSMVTETADPKISEDSSSEKKTAGISLEKEEVAEVEDAKKDETPAAQDLKADEPEDQSLISSSTLPSEDVEHVTLVNADEKDEEKVKEVELLVKEKSQEPEAVMDQEIAVAQASSTEESLETISAIEKPDDEERNEADKLVNENCEDSSTRGTEEICLQKEEPNELHAVQKEEIISVQTSSEEKLEEHISTSAIIGEEHEHGTKNIEDEKTIKEEIIKEEIASDARKVEDICSQKEGSNPEAVVEDETTTGLILTEKKLEEQVENPDKAESSLDDNGKDQKEELQVGEVHAASTLPSKEQEDERKEMELQEEESPKKIIEQTREIEEASNVKTDVAIEEKLVKESNEARDEENQCEKTSEGNETSLNEVSKEEVTEDKEVTETSYSTSPSEELTKDSSGGDELTNEQVEDKTNEAFKTTTCQDEELIVEAQKSSENETIEKHIVFEDKPVEVPGEASVARIEDSATVTEEGPAVELPQAGGTKDLGGSNDIADDIQQPEETGKASDKQIPRELDPTEIADLTSSIGKEDVPIDLQDKVAESSEKAEVGNVKEVYSKVEEVENGAEKATDDTSEEITKESVPAVDSTNTSLSDHVESSTKEIVQVTAQDKTEKGEVEDKTSAAQILVGRPEEESSAPSFEFPSKEGKHGVTVKVDAVEKEELKEVETLDREPCDTKPGAEICLEKKENKELKAVTEQETIVVQPPTDELKKDKELAQPTVSHFEEVHREPAYETQNEELPVQTQKDSSNNNIEKEIIAEEKTKDLEQASVGMKKERIAEEIPGEAYPVESTGTTSPTGKEHFPIEQQERAVETPDKAEEGKVGPGNAQEICSEAGVDLGQEKKTDSIGVEVTQEPASADSPKSSLSDLLQISGGEKLQVVKDVIQERELIVSQEETHVAEEETLQVTEAKTEEEKEEGEEGDEHNNKADSGSDAPVMVEAPRDTDTKPHKKSHNILSGMGSKVKHSISKVKKAITGKSSHPKEPKPTSPKEKESEK